LVQIPWTLVQKYLTRMISCFSLLRIFYNNTVDWYVQVQSALSANTGNEDFVKCMIQCAQVGEGKSPGKSGKTWILPNFSFLMKKDERDYIHSQNSSTRFWCLQLNFIFLSVRVKIFLKKFCTKYGEVNFFFFRPLKNCFAKKTKHVF